MRNKAWFSILFMFICTAFFTAILSTVFVSSRPLIQANNRMTEFRAQLNALQLAIPAVSGPIDLEKFYNEQVSEQDVNGISVYMHEDESGGIYYALPFSGSGLWGKINGIIALDKDIKNVIGIDFISQNETPGLGGRIKEAWYIDQFNNITLYEDSNPIRYASSTADGQIDAITGATLTSDAVVNMLNETINQAKDKLGGEN